MSAFYFCVGVASPGQPLWLKGVAYPGAWCKPRGTATVENDDCVYFYRVRRAERRAFKTWAADAFDGGMNLNRLRGSFPNYHVVTCG